MLPAVSVWRRLLSLPLSLGSWDRVGDLRSWSLPVTWARGTDVKSVPPRGEPDQMTAVLSDGSFYVWPTDKEVEGHEKPVIWQNPQQILRNCRCYSRLLLVVCLFKTVPKWASWENLYLTTLETNLKGTHLFTRETSYVSSVQHRTLSFSFQLFTCYTNYCLFPQKGISPEHIHKRYP